MTGVRTGVRAQSSVLAELRRIPALASAAVVATGHQVRGGPRGQNLLLLTAPQQGLQLWAPVGWRQQNPPPRAPPLTPALVSGKGGAGLALGWGPVRPLPGASSGWGWALAGRAKRTRPERAPDKWPWAFASLGSALPACPSAPGERPGAKQVNWPFASYLCPSRVPPLSPGQALCSHFTCILSSATHGPRSRPVCR